MWTAADWMPNEPDFVGRFNLFPRFPYAGCKIHSKEIQRGVSGPTHVEESAVTAPLNEIIVGQSATDRLRLPAIECKQHTTTLGIDTGQQLFIR
jgi:hypothetical protein